MPAVAIAAPSREMVVALVAAWRRTGGAKLSRVALYIHARITLSPKEKIRNNARKTPFCDMYNGRCQGPQITPTRMADVNPFCRS
jgi:hypothetical protein